VWARQWELGQRGAGGGAAVVGEGRVVKVTRGNRVGQGEGRQYSARQCMQVAPEEKACLFEDSLS